MQGLSKALLEPEPNGVEIRNLWPDLTKINKYCRDLYINPPSSHLRLSSFGIFTYQKQTNKQTPWPLVRERIIPTERPPLVDEIFTYQLQEKLSNNAINSVGQAIIKRTTLSQDWFKQRMHTLRSSMSCG
jgi:hypothetical protein